GATTQKVELRPMDEIERLKRQVEQLQKALNDRQQLDRPKSLPALIDNLEFIADCARFSEGLLSEQAVRKKYRFTEEAWTALGNDEALIERVELEKTRRIRNGDTAPKRSTRSPPTDHKQQQSKTGS